MKTILSQAELLLSQLEATSPKTLELYHWKRLFKLRKNLACLLNDHDPKTSDSKSVMELLERTASLEQRFTDMAAASGAKSLDEVSYKLSQWVIHKALNAEGAKPEDSSDALVLSVFRDLIELNANEDLNRFMFKKGMCKSTEEHIVVQLKSGTD